MRKILTGLLITAFLGGVSCSGVPGPDKSVEGSILGGVWGAGAGAVLANQTTGALGHGAAIGLAFGAVSGLLVGLGLDVQESYAIQQQHDIDALRVQVAANERELRKLQASFDDRERSLNAANKSQAARVFFDEGRASLHWGSAVELERLADEIKLNPFIGSIEIHGHSEDLGNEDKNVRLSEARARTVATFLTEHGVSSHLFKIVAHGSSQPLTSNNTPEGKQQNRRVEVVLLK